MNEEWWTRRCYIEKNKTDPFHIPTDWTVFHLSREFDVVTLKKTLIMFYFTSSSDFKNKFQKLFEKLCILREWGSRATSDFSIENRTKVRSLWEKYIMSMVEVYTCTHVLVFWSAHGIIAPTSCDPTFAAFPFFHALDRSPVLRTCWSWCPTFAWWEHASRTTVRCLLNH